MDKNGFKLERLSQLVSNKVGEREGERGRERESLFQKRKGKRGNEGNGNLI